MEKGEQRVTASKNALKLARIDQKTSENDLGVAEAWSVVARCRQNICIQVSKTLFGLGWLGALCYLGTVYKKELVGGASTVWSHVEEIDKESLAREVAAENAFVSVNYDDYFLMNQLQKGEINMASFHFRLHGNWSGHVVTVHCVRGPEGITVGQIVFNAPQGEMEPVQVEEGLAELEIAFTKAFENFIPREENASHVSK